MNHGSGGALGRRTASRRAMTALASIALLAGPAVVVPSSPALAAGPTPSFSELLLSHHVSTWNAETALCADGPVVRQLPDEADLPEGKLVTANVSQKQTFSHDDHDSLTFDISQNATARSATAGGLPRSVRLDFAGRGSAVSRQPTSVCLGNALASSTIAFTFRTAAPLWATLSYAKAGKSYAEAYLYSTADGSRPYEELYGYGLKSSGSTTVLLPPGEYSGYVTGQTFLPETRTSKSTAANGSVQIAFDRTGSPTAAPAGNAKGYAAFGAARSCAAHILPARLTSSSKRIKAVSRVTFAVNGRTVKTLKGRQLKRGLAVKLPIRDDAAAAVRATVKLKNGKTRTLAAGYRACA